MDEEAIFDQALQISDRAARAAFLAQACGQNSALRASVTELLACLETAGNYLETPCVRSLATPDTLPTDGAGDRYELLERLGGGGCGVVYRAKQREPIQRDVAIKVLHAGLDTRDVVNRFEAERQVLGIMNHPHIAAVFDAGTTREGQPFFVMEFVDGLPLDQFLSQHPLPLRATLDMFLQIGQAVQHAHLRGIVHRDLKPSNVMITTLDQRLVAKVIDFGVAKAIQTQDDVSSNERVERQILGTPAYMSPEQLESGSDIDTRADVYALGGILYQLLTGVSPLPEDADSRSDWHSWCRRVRTEVPLAPSARVAQMDSEGIAILAKRHQTTPQGLRRHFTADLDAIVAKSLEKDRAQRYATVHELIRDIEHLLRDEEVIAYPATWRYRLRKFVRRHRVATLAMVGVTLSLWIGGLATTIGFIRARRESQRATREWHRAELERDRARAQTIKAQQALQWLERMVGAAHPDQGHAADYSLRQMLNDFSESFDRDVETQPDIAARLHRTLGKAYWGLGDMPRAGKHLERALDLLCTETTGNGVDLARTQVDYALYLLRISKISAAQQTIEQAWPVLQAESTDEQLVWGHFVRAAIHHEYGEARQVAACLAEAAAMATTHLGEHHPLTLAMNMRLAGASVEGTTQGPDDAAAMATRTLATMEQLTTCPRITIADAQRIHARIQSRLGNDAEAESLLREAIATHREILGTDNSRVALDLLALARVVRRLGRDEEGLKLVREALTISERATTDRESTRYQVTCELATMLEPTAPKEAITIWTQAIRERQQILGSTAELARQWAHVGNLQVEQEQPHDAIAAYSDALRMLEETRRAWDDDPATLPKTKNSLLYMTAMDLLRIQHELQQPDAMKATLKRIEQHASAAATPASQAVFALAASHVKLAEGDLAEAKRLLEEAASQFQDGRYWMMQVRAAMIESSLLQAQERPGEAFRVLRRAYKLANRHAATNDNDLPYIVARHLVALATRNHQVQRANNWRARMQRSSETTRDDRSADRSPD